LPDKDFILKEANKRCKGTLVSTLDIEFIDVGENYLTAKMLVSPKLHQPDGVLHGGATAALATHLGEPDREGRKVENSKKKKDKKANGAIDKLASKNQ
jgi:hypothetical protein